MTQIAIDIVSDIACPWCAIGYARLEKAMDALKDDMDFTVAWHAFELNPDPSGDGEPILPALSRKYGRSEDEMRANQAQMMDIANGLDGSQAREVLASDQYAEAVREEEAQYQQAGVSAVPAYIINQKYLISGAQEPETLVNAFREIAESA